MSSARPSSGSSGASWFDHRADFERRNLRAGVALSFTLHAVVIGLLFYAPEPEPMRLPEVISVKMVALPGAPAPQRKAVKQVEAPSPAPKPPPPKPAQTPPPAPKKVLLPKREQQVTKKRKPKPKPMEYDDALAALRDELGEPEPPPEAPEASEDVLDSETLAALSEPDEPTGGSQANAEFAAWQLATLRHVRQAWRVPKDFLEQGLVAGVLVTLSATGDVLGQPEVSHTSGNPYFDDETVRALLRATPLPAPPEAGDWQFRFTADEGS